MANKKIIQLTTNSTPSLTGYTVYDDGIATYKTSLNSLKTTILTGTTSASGSVNQLAFFSGNNRLTSSWFTHMTNGTLGLGTSAVNSVEPERLMVDNYNSYNIATFQTSQNDTYGEVNIINFGSGSNSSADLVIWNDRTSEGDGYLDLGLNSSTYGGGEIGYQSDGYLYSAANDLYIGSLGTGWHGHLHLFGGNMWDSSSISIYNDGTVGFGTDWLNNYGTTIPSSEDGFKYEFSGSVKFDSDIKIDGSIYTDNIYGLTKNGNQLNLNGGFDGAEDIELDSIGNISLWAEGGNVNVTGSLNINGSSAVTSDSIIKIETMTASAYAQITPVNGTLYIIIN